MREEIRQGTAPDRIAFVAFSRRAAGEARARAREELGLSDDDLRHWGTLHSTAARQLGVGGRVLGTEHWAEIGKVLGLRFDPPDEAGRVAWAPELGRRLQYLHGLARARREPLKDVWGMSALERLAGGTTRLPWPIVARFAATLDRYRRDEGLYDYADLLDDAPGGLPVDVVVIDEAQDLTPAQWSYARRLWSGAARRYVAGDDDQAIYDWAGADVARFLSLAGDRRVLDRSYRLPRRVHALADQIARRIQRRQPKTWSAADREGDIRRVVDPSRVPVAEGQWLLLGRTRAELSIWAAACQTAGVPYTREGRPAIRATEARAIRAWETARRGTRVAACDLERALGLTGRPTILDDGAAYSLADLGWPDAPPWRVALSGIAPARRRYYEACLRRSSRALTDPPQVTVATIHGVKGAEADRVALLTDLTPRVAAGYRADPDAEHRVWYVGATRAREELWLVYPRGDLSYRFPAS